MVVYQVFARKWRPKSFASLKGQNHITRALTNALKRRTLHHAYLFTGTRGVGKTTVARILAKCLNCEQGVTPIPCGDCSICKEIDAGRFADLIEVDAASRTKVEDTRELLDNVQYAPSSGRYKIYLIDEVHMLSGHSFNALLKTLEEPPPYVIFILATTDPTRIPITVLSRCIQFNLKALSIQDITEGLKEILSAEHISYEEIALRKIAHAASGSMRDALSLLEQAVAFSEGEIKTLEIEEMLGMSYQRFLPGLLNGLGTKDVKACLQAVESMSATGADFEQVLDSLLQVLHATAIVQTVPQYEALSQFANANEDHLLLKDKLLPEEVQLMYQIGLMAKKELCFAPTARMGLEMALLRMNVFCPKEVNLINLELHTDFANPIIHTSQADPLVEPKLRIASRAEALVQPDSLKKASALTPQSLDWPKIVQALSLSGLSRMLVQHSVVETWEKESLTIKLDPSQKAYLNQPRQIQIQDALSQYFGKAIKLNITIGEVGNASPIKQSQVQSQERQEKLEVAVSQDKTVQNILSTFGATIENITAKE